MSLMIAPRPKVIIVWGPPASGKTTYVKRHMTDGDLVIDLDLIKQAISTATKTGAPDSLSPTALSVRAHLYDLAAARKVDCDTIWVVAGLPRQEERDEQPGRVCRTGWEAGVKSRGTEG